MTMEINKITGEKTRHSTSNTSKPSPEKVYPYEPKPASYPLTFVNYGTFTGKADMDYTYEDNYVENEDSEGKLPPNCLVMQMFFPFYNEVSKAWGLI